MADIPDVSTADEMFDHFWGTGARTPDELAEASVRIGRNPAVRLVCLLWVAGLLTPEAATANVADTWSSAEWPQDALTRADWQALFTLAGYTDDGVAVSRPTQVLRLYRGATHRYRRRWSWTDDLAQAEWFARRYRSLDDTARVWTALVEPWRLFARVHASGRSESEYVLDTQRLKIVAASPP